MLKFLQLKFFRSYGFMDEDRKKIYIITLKSIYKEYFWALKQFYGHRSEKSTEILSFKR